MEIVGLSYSQTQNGAYALVLSELGGKRRLPIIIGGFEAQENHWQGRDRRHRGQDCAHSARQRVQRRPQQAANHRTRFEERGVRPRQSA